jgi:hypothetical protein
MKRQRVQEEFQGLKPKQTWPSPLVLLCALCG